MTSASALEWDRFLELAEKEARTVPGKVLVLADLEPAHWASDVPAAETRQHETSEVFALIDRDAFWGPLTDLADPAEVLENLRRGSVLEIPMLGLLRAWLYAVDSWGQMPREEIRGERLRKSIASLPDPLQPLRVLERVLTPEGELSEKASPKLAQLYSEIRGLKKEISATLDHLMKTFSQKGVLQEAFTDVRDGRYVLPVKISSQGDVDGIVYEASASKQTVFIEPREVAPMNNRLRRLQNDLTQEIFAILEDTSKKLLPYAEEIALGVSILAHWDSVQARARLGRHYSGKPLTVREDRAFRLRTTAHPLLWWSLPKEKIIRNDIDFEDPARTLLLTGPNTGGKTVFLKTLGMAAICARTGYPFPATENPIVPFFDAVFTDLGDAQSIEEHLSSFSGHIERFKEILATITERSLVLLDELNTATDPEEGAALGRAFLETIMSHGAMIVATTHDPHLKALAINDGRILNASMEFDEAARTPTFLIVTGVPGRSRAIETAERLGIAADVIALARSYLAREHVQFETLLGQLESDSREAARARKEAVSVREEAERLRKEWTERTQKSVGELLEKTRQRLRRVLEQAQDEVRASVRKLDEIRSRRDLDETRSKLNESFSRASARMESALAEEAPELAEQLAVEAKAAPEPLLEIPLEKGSVVRIPKWKATGTVLEIADGKVKVAMGKIQMTLSKSDVEALSETEASKIASIQSGKKATPAPRVKDIDRPSAPPSQIDLRGMRYDDAMSALERYLDQAFRSGALADVTIVHGLGSGALREGTRKLLSELPYVKEYRDGGIGMGGAGATIVEFDR